MTMLTGPSETLAPDSNVEFADFVRANTACLMRKAYRLTGSALAAEELLQDTLVRLYPQWTRVVKADAPLAYVSRSLTNHFVSLQRRSSREIVRERLPDIPVERSAEDDVVDGDALWALLQELGSRQRAAIVLRCYYGMTDLEVAEVLGCRPGTVRSLVSRGLARLRWRAPAELRRTA